MDKSEAPPRQWAQRYADRHGVRDLRLTTAAARATAVTIIRRTAIVKGSSVVSWDSFSTDHEFGVKAHAR